MTIDRGNIAAASPPPSEGERVEGLARLEGFHVEYIHSGTVGEPVDYLQDHDEWVVVLGGLAVVEVGGERLEMRDGDWAVLPSGVPHRLVTVEAGTRWIAVHGPQTGRAAPDSP
jgi:cupin 2 domain-containing protein